MGRTRISTTVDEQLLNDVRNAGGGVRDSELLDQALKALRSRQRSAEIDRSYQAYDRHPLSEPDEWGDLESFHRAVRAS